MDTLLLHQRFCPRPDFSGLGWLATFDLHGGLHGLDDFPIEAGGRLHTFPNNQPAGLKHTNVASAGVIKVQF
ncbi:MAG: hypothetical protein HY018_12235 [Hydrogenophilales bacterium]|nr:hypothetical protein [Hydrogenophilales bacterium]